MSDERSMFSSEERTNAVVVRRANVPTLANAGYPFVTHDSANGSARERTRTRDGRERERRARRATTTTSNRDTRRIGNEGKSRERVSGEYVLGGDGVKTTRAYVRVEDVIASTRAAEEALKRATTTTTTTTMLTKEMASERERVKRYAQAQIEVGEQRRAIEEKERENRMLIEENERLVRELGGTSTSKRASGDDGLARADEDVDETVKELFDMVDSERRERRALEEKLGAYEREVQRALGEARNESAEAQRKVEDAEATVREQDMKLSQAADIIGELRTALLQVMETRPRDDDDVTESGRALSEAPSDAVEAVGGTPLERTTAAVRVWEGKVEKLVIETVRSALVRAMDSPALQSSKRQGEQVISSVTDAINHELSSIVENAMSGIVDEMRFQFGQNEREHEDEANIGGRKRFIVWLADENMRRAHLEDQLHTVQDELARSEASRQVATQRWLQAMNQIEGSVYEDESDLGDVLSRLDELSDDGNSVYSFDGGAETRGVRNRRAASVAGDMPARSRFRSRRDQARSETHDYANLNDVAPSPVGASMPTFREEDEKEDDEAHADVAIVATPGGRLFLIMRGVMRSYVAPLVYGIAKCVYTVCAFCASSPTFELVWPMALILIAFYWKLGFFAAASSAMSSVYPKLETKSAAAAASLAAKPAESLAANANILSATPSI